MGLLALLTQAGHVPADPEAVSGEAVWVLDIPADTPLDIARAEAPEEGRAFVLLVDRVEDGLAYAQGASAGWACLPRDSDAEDLDLAVRAAAAGLVLLDPRATAGALGQTVGIRTDAASRALLTNREQQVLQLVAEGYPNKGIAARLGISERTAKYHVASLTMKVGAASRTELVTLAARHGLLVL